MKIRRNPGEIYKGHTIYKCHTQGLLDLFWDIEPGAQEFTTPDKAKEYIDAKMSSNILPPTRQKEQEQALNEAVGRGVLWAIRKLRGE